MIDADEDLSRCMLSESSLRRSDSSGIRVKSEAVMVILKRCQEHELEMIASSVLEYEIGKAPDPGRRSRVGSLLALANTVAEITADAAKRAEALQRMGLSGIDALHVAIAEMNSVDVFLTVDDRLLKRCSENSESIRVRVDNPVSWLTEVY